MPLSEELLNILVCPKCKGVLNYEPEHPALTCAFCKLRYPVRNDIPVMLVDEAESIGGE